jgi:hypothetical protein
MKRGAKNFNLVHQRSWKSGILFGFLWWVYVVGCEKFKFNLHFSSMKKCWNRTKAKDLVYQSPSLLPDHFSSSFHAIVHVNVHIRWCALYCTHVISDEWHPTWRDILHMERGRINIHSFRIHFRSSIHKWHSFWKM